MERQEFCKFLIEDADDYGVLSNFAILEIAYRLIKKLDNEREKTAINSLIYDYELNLGDDNTRFFYNNEWYDVIEFLTEFAPKNSGFEYTLEPFDFKFNGVSIYDTSKFYSEILKEINGGK